MTITNIEYLVLRYTLRPQSLGSVNVAVVLNAPEVGFCDMTIRDNWRPVSLLDPEADVEMLKLALDDIQHRLRDPSGREAMLNEILESFSNMLRRSPQYAYRTSHDPQSELEHISKKKLRLRTVRPGRSVKCLHPDDEQQRVHRTTC
jgi:hypothetical protein